MGIYTVLCPMLKAGSGCLPDTGHLQGTLHYVCISCLNINSTKNMSIKFIRPSKSHLHFKYYPSKLANLPNTAGSNITDLQ